MQLMQNRRTMHVLSSVAAAHGVAFSVRGLRCRQ